MLYPVQAANQPAIQMFDLSIVDNLILQTLATMIMITTRMNYLRKLNYLRNLIHLRNQIYLDN